jgi:Ca-activated chloride channel family protein
MKKNLFFLLIYHALLNNIFAQDQGVQDYRNKKYKSAQEYYDSILSDDSNNLEALFGKGSSLFMQDSLKTAQSSFNATLSLSENQLKSKALYNLGNISFKNQKLDEALSFYRKALELNPEDDEARYNYEFIKYQKNPPEDKDEEKKDEEKKDEEKKDEEKKDEEKKDESKDGKQKPQDEKKSQDLKKAESILDAIKNDEKVMQKQQIKRAKTRKLLKDW